MVYAVNLALTAAYVALNNVDLAVNILYNLLNYCGEYYVDL